MHLSYLEIGISTLLGAWFIASVLNQLSLPCFARIAMYDRFALLPLWTFFAPNPGQSDYHLVYRDRAADGSTSEWREIEITEERRALSLLWNPEKRSKKVLSDLVSVLLTSMQASPEMERAIVVSVPYLLLLNVVNDFPRCSEAADRQFVVVETFGFHATAQSRVLLRSDYHPLPTGA